jgi:hypothetical protein
MFILYAIPFGLLIGWLLGGRLANLGNLQVRWAPVALIGLLAQVVLFLGPVADRVGDLGAPIYIGSTGLVLAVVIRNARIPGLAIVAVGATSNLAAIVANGGHMPTTPGALEALGRSLSDGYSNSAVLKDPALWPLTDLFALPRFIPFANVFSIGDALIAVGVVMAIVAGMRTDGASGNLVPEASRH